MTKKPILDNWEEEFSRYYGAQFECYDFEALMDDIKSLLQAQKERDVEIAKNYIPCCSRRPTAGDEIAAKILNQHEND